MEQMLITQIIIIGTILVSYNILFSIIMMVYDKLKKIYFPLQLDAARGITLKANLYTYFDKNHVMRYKEFRKIINKTEKNVKMTISGNDLPERQFYKYSYKGSDDCNTKKQ